MTAKSIVSLMLLLFVAASVVYLVVGESRAPTGPRSSESAPDTVAPALTPVPTEPAKPRPRLIAYYFHRTQRCHTCLTMEAYAEQALRERFLDAFSSGAVEWHVVDYEAPENEHFVHDYELTSNGLVMVRFENGEQKEWKNLERIWDLVDNEGEFKEYVVNEALAYRQGGF